MVARVAIAVVHPDVNYAKSSATTFSEEREIQALFDGWNDWN